MAIVAMQALMVALACAVVSAAPVSPPVRLPQERASRLSISAPAPDYPELAKRIHQQDLIRIEIVVSEKGNVIAATCLSGDPLLAQAAEDAAKKRTYRPLLVNGKARAFVTIVEYGGPAGFPYPTKNIHNIVTRFESNIEPPHREICTGNRAFYPAKAGQSNVTMDRRQRFEIRTCGVGGTAQVLMYESNQQRPTLVYTTGDTWPLRVHHIVNILVVPLTGTAGGVLVFHFKNGVVQPVSGGDTQYSLGIQENEDGTELSVSLPHANRGSKTQILRFPIEY